MTDTQNADVIKFNCSFCDQRLGVKSQFAGKRVRCTKCRSVMAVPHQTESVDQVEHEHKSKRKHMDLSALDRHNKLLEMDPGDSLPGYSGSDILSALEIDHNPWNPSHRSDEFEAATQANQKTEQIQKGIEEAEKISQENPDVTELEMVDMSLPDAPLSAMELLGTLEAGDAALQTVEDEAADSGIRPAADPKEDKKDKAQIAKDKKRFNLLEGEKKRGLFGRKKK